MPKMSDIAGRILLPLITPFMHDDTIDHDRLGELANYLLDREYCDALIVAGTTGEFYALTLEERVGLLRSVLFNSPASSSSGENTRNTPSLISPLACSPGM